VRISVGVVFEEARMIKQAGTHRHRSCPMNGYLRAGRLVETAANGYHIGCSTGATWLRRGSRNRRCMPRCSDLVNNAATKIVANDDNYALAA